MGLWIIGTGVLKIEPIPEDDLIRDYIDFSESVNPYEEYDDFFANPWFFDDGNNLQSIAGKFAEPSVWLKYIYSFFEERGYKIIGDAEIAGEDLQNFWEISEEKYSNYKNWLIRKEELLKHWYQDEEWYQK